MKLNKLFKRRTDGGVQEWTVEVQDNKYRVISGINDGSLVTSEWTVCDGKNIGRANATTATEQALSEAQSKWQKQYDKGYREDVDDVDNLAQFKPMLAKIWGDYKDKTRFPVWTQRKYDGVRLIARKDGLWSRNGKPILSVPHLFEALKPLFAKDPSLILDGEIYADKFAKDFNTIISLARKSKPNAEDLAEAKANLHYFVYDIPSCPGTFSKRYETLRQLLTDLNNPAIVLVPTYLVHDEKELDGLYEQFLNEGAEGQMVRLDARYESKRTSSLLKRKEHVDAEFIVLGIEEGVGNKSGMAGRMLFKTKDGKDFASALTGNVEQFKEILRNKNDYIGKEATVRYTNLTPDGIPRFPRVVAIRDYE